jgi:hypothetical protein
MKLKDVGYTSDGEKILELKSFKGFEKQVACETTNKLQRINK